MIGPDGLDTPAGHKEPDPMTETNHLPEHIRFRLDTALPVVQSLLSTLPAGAAGEVQDVGCRFPSVRVKFTVAGRDYVEINASLLYGGNVWEVSTGFWSKTVEGDKAVETLQTMAAVIATVASVVAILRACDK